MSNNTLGCGGRCHQSLDFEFTMAFQPIVDVDARRIYSYEALIRGPNGEPAHGVLSKVTEANRYSFDQVCRVKAIEMAVALRLDRRLNINILPNAVYDAETCLRATLSACRRTGFSPKQITFEFTENEPVLDKKHLANIVETYRSHGFMTALDDFGAGYAGLALLADFRPDVIKIDRELVRDIDSNRIRQAIVSGLIETAKNLDIAVTAEGVEREAELDILRAMGIRFYQGFLFARPAVGHLVADEEIYWA